MADTPKRERKFNDEEVALIIKRAAELQQTEQAQQDPGSALSLTEVEEIAREAGIDPKLIRRAAVGLDQPAQATGHRRGSEHQRASYSSASSTERFPWRNSRR